MIWGHYNCTYYKCIEECSASLWTHRKISPNLFFFFFFTKTNLLYGPLCVQLFPEKVFNTTVWCQFGMLFWHGSFLHKPLEKKQNGTLSPAYRGIYKKYRQPKCRCSECSAHSIFKKLPKRLKYNVPSSYWSLFLVMPRIWRGKGEAQHQRKKTCSLDWKKTFHQFYIHTVEFT